jgi:Gluconate 2-dehydrogenase subunit 3
MPDPELTRRLWILGVGETALGLGLAGAVGASTGETVALPPGLYEPLADHLGHALQSAGHFHPIPPDSPTDYVRPKSEPFDPLFFSRSEFAVIRRLTELLLGEEAETGNDKREDVVEEVAEWIDLSVFSSARTREAALSLDRLHRAVRVAYHAAEAVHNLETFDAQKICRDGLVWLAEQSKSRGDTNFLHLGENEQKQILTLVSDGRSDKRIENSGTRFFKLMKAEVVRGFYTSPIGLKELDFKGNGFYARSPGCNRA